MPSVDKRIVEMRFDNEDFEADVSESISSIDKLKNALKFKDCVDGMDEIDRAAESLNKKFSLLGTLGDQLVRNLANEIYSLKTQFVDMVKSLSIDQVAAGWDKYATKTSAVQTIMAATANQIEDEGERMEYVNEQLERLNWFTDETSYNLIDMTNNIGKFTNNGQDLESSVTAMQGIATWAGLSGANVQQASHAMYNLSQALSVGAVTNLDWRSIENAQMATVEFKQTALDTAVALGTLKKKAEGVYETLNGKEVTVTTFNQQLTTERWFNKDVLMKTLDKYGGFANALADEMSKIEEKGANLSTSKFLEFLDKYLAGTLNIEAAAKATGLSTEELANDLKKLGSEEFALGRKAFKAAQEAKTFQEAIDATKDAVSSGWMQTFETIFGDYSNAKKLWTRLSNELWDVFAAGGAARNEMLSEWAELGGYDKLWDAVWKIWAGLKGIGTRIADMWHQIFPGLDAQRLLDITEKFYEFSQKFYERFAIVDEVIGEVAEKTGTLWDRVKGVLHSGEDANASETIEELDALTEASDDYAVRLARTMADIEELEARVWSGDLGNNPDRRRQVEEEGYNYEYLQNVINETAGNAFRYEIAEEAVIKATKYLNGELENQNEEVSSLSEGLDDSAEAAQNARTWIDDLSDVLGGFKSALDLIIEAGKLVYKYIITPAWNFLVNTFKKLLAVIAPFSRAFSDFVARLKESGTISKNIEKFINWFKELKENLKGQENVQKFLGYIDQLKEKVEGLKEKSFEKITGFFDRIVNLDIDLPDVEKIGQWFDEFMGHINPLIEKLQTIEGFWPKVKAFFDGLDFSGAAAFGQSAAEGISEFFKALFSNDELKNAGKTWLDSIWEGIQEKIKEIDWSEIINTAIKALAGASLIKLALALSNMFNSVGNTIKGSVGIIDDIGNLLSSMSVTLKATAILEVALAIGIVAAAMFALSKIDSDKLANVTVDMALIIVALSFLMKALGKFGTFFSGNESKKLNNNIGNIAINMPKLGITLIGLALAIGSLVLAVSVLSKIKLGSLAKTFVFLFLMFSTLAGLAVALDKLKVNGNRMIALAGSFVVLGIGLNLLAVAVAALTGIASLNIEGMKTSVVAIIALLFTFAAAAYVASKVDNIIAISFAFVLMSGAILLIIPSLLALSKALSSKNWWSMLAAVGVIILLLGTFIGAIALLSLINKKVGKINRALVAIAVLAGVVAIIGGVLFALSVLVPPENLLITAAVLLVFVAALTALGGIAGYFAFISAGLIAIGSAISLFGIGILSAGVGVLAFAKALQILSDASLDTKQAGKNLADGLTSFVEELSKSMDSISTFVDGVLQIIIDNGIKAVVSFIVKLIYTIYGARYDIAVTVLSVIGTILYVIAMNMETIATFLGYLIADLINSLAIMVRDTSGVIFQAALNLGAALVDTLSTGLQTALSSRAQKNDIVGWFLRSISDEAFNESWRHTVEDFDLLTGGIFGISDSVDLNTIRHPWIAFSEAVLGAAHEATSNLEETQDVIKEGLTNTKDEFVSNLDMFSSQGTKAVEDYEDPYQALNDKTSTDNNTDFLTNLLSGQFDASALVDDNFDVGKMLGFNIVDGKIEGYSLEESKYLNMLEQSSYDELDAMSDPLEINSPSKATERFGKYTIQGFEIGFKKYSWITIKSISTWFDVLKNLIKTKASELQIILYNSFNKAMLTSFDDTTSIENSLNSVISRIADAIEGDFDMRPVITPVLDLSEIQNGQGRISSILGTGAYMFNPNLSYSMDRATGVVAAAGIMSPNSFDLTESVASLRQEVAQISNDNKTIVSALKQYLPYIPEISHMQITLDKKALVGELTPAVDQSLGNKVTNRRG